MGSHSNLSALAGGVLRWTLGLVVALGATGALGCSSDDGETSGSGGAGAAGGNGSGNGGSGAAMSCGTAQFAPAACQTCLEGACCDELAGCAADCQSWIDCANGCNGDLGCKADCDAASPAGASDAATLDACVTASCNAECGGGTTNPNAICDSGFALEDDPTCAACLSESCCDAYTDCAASPDCFDCLSATDPGACDATDLDDAIVTCVMGQCDADCD